jgi:trehalose 6-phosphate phosphatase
MAEPDQAPPLSLLADGAALFLDFDGTLVELAEAPDAILVPGDLHPLLERLAERLDGRLALLSGRAIADLDSHLAIAGVAVSGSHGLELRLAGGTCRPIAAPPGLAAARAAVAAYAAAAPGLLVETKPASVALHFRSSPESAEAVCTFAEELAAQSGLIVQYGKMVAELRAPGPSKGDALRTLMAEPAFAGARPVFLGDDLTDEDAFAAAVAMGGAGVLVGPARESHAHWRLPDVNAVAAWLAAAAAAGPGNG